MTTYKWYNNGESEIYINSEECIPNGFTEGRLSKLHQLKNQISKEQLYKLYIIENKPFDIVFKELNITRKDLRRLLTYYKIKKDAKQRSLNNTYKRSKEIVLEVAAKSSMTQKKRWEEISPEFKQYWSAKCRDTMLNLDAETANRKSLAYKSYWKSLSDKQRQEINSRRSASCRSAWSNPYLIEKSNETKRINRLKSVGRLCRTLAEQKLYDKLIALFPDTLYDIKVDDRYPFYCDFYIPSLDLFIELQAHPSHGRLPIEMMSIEEYSKYKSSWADVFGRRDVEKLQYITKNNLNFIRVYPNATIEENYTINKNTNKEIIDICYRSQK